MPTKISTSNIQPATLELLTAGGGGGGGVTAYDTIGNLPVSANAGDMGYVTETNGLYIWNGAVWFLILTATTPNNTPYITQGPEIGYFLSTNGTPTVITLAAQDPEGIPIIWGYNITAGTLGDTATITQNNNVFTITPSTQASNGGQFELTFTASDGVNVVNARTLIRLRFTPEDYGIGLTPQNTLFPAGFGSSTNAGFGKSISAAAGMLAVTGAARLENGNADVNNNIVSVYSALGGSQIVPSGEISAPAGIRHFGENNIAVWGNMVMVPGQRFEVANIGGTLTNIYYRTVHVYYRINGTFELTQTIEFPAGVPVIHESNGNANPIITNPAQPLSVSSSGLVMACATPAQSTGQGGVQLRIYTRESTATTTWTLRQTVTNSFSGMADYDSFPTMINISSTGKHIALVSPATDDGGSNFGKIYILTNLNLNLGTYTWSATGSINVGTGTTDLGVTSTIKSDDIFYFYARRTAHAVEMLKYDPSSASWLRFSYNHMINRVFALNPPLNINQHNHAHFTAIPGRDGTNEVIFLGTVQDPFTTGVSLLAMMRVKNFDISVGSPAGSDNASINNSQSWHINLTRIPNAGNLTIVNLLPYLSVDQISGQVYLSTRGTYGGVTNSGGVTQYVPITVSDTSKTTAFSKTWYNPTQNFQTNIQQASVTETITVQPGQNFLHAVCVGGGGSGGQIAQSGTAGGGGGGGGLRWISGYPVFPGDQITITVGAGGALGQSGRSSTIVVNGVTILEASGGMRGTGQASAALGGTGTATGTFSLGGINYTLGGGNGGAGETGGSNGTGSSGGGAGGYNAVGGNAGSAAGVSGAGGGGGGGGWTGNSALFGFFGGGVGLYGIGANGGAPTTAIRSPTGSLDLGLDVDAVTAGNVSINKTNNPTYFYTARVVDTVGSGGVGSIRDNTSLDAFCGHGGGVRLILGSDRYIIGGTNTSFFIRPLTYIGA